MLIIHEAFAVLLLYTCFCRAVKMNSGTRRTVRLAFYALSLSALLCVFAPLTFKWRPDFVSLALLVAVVIVQMVTSSYWRDGIPQHFKERISDALH